MLTLIKLNVRIILVIFTVCLTVAAYLQAINFPMFSDDFAYVVFNRKLASLSFIDLWEIFTKPFNFTNEYSPLRDLSFWIDIKLLGYKPAVYRLHNILLFLLCIPLVYSNTSRLWKYFRPNQVAEAPWAAAVTTSLFVLHPALVEAVLWISDRKYILTEFFALLAIWFALGARKESGLSPKHALATLLAIVAMMLSRATFVGVTLLICLLWFGFWRDIPENNRRHSDLLWPLSLIAVSGLLTIVFVFEMKGFDSLPVYFNGNVVYRSLAINGGLARLIFIPESRNFLHPLYEDSYFLEMVLTGAGLLIAGISGLVICVRKKSLGWFLIASLTLLFVPFLQLIPNKQPSLIADRFVTPALLPAMMLITVAFFNIRATKIRVITIVVLALLFSIQTIQRPLDWAGSKQLMYKDVQAYPGYYLPASFEIILYQLPEGSFSEAKATAENISNPEFRTAMEEAIETYYQVNIESIKTGSTEKAISLLNKMESELQSLPAQAQWDIPVYRLWKLRNDQVTGLWISLVKNFPDNVIVLTNAAQRMYNVGNYKNAALYFANILDSNKLSKTMLGRIYEALGYSELRTGRFSEAESALLSALNQFPPDYEAYCYLQLVYHQMGDLNKEAQAKESCQIFGPN